MKYHYLKFLIVVIFPLSLLSGCTSDNQDPESGKEATLIYIQWDEGVAYTHLAESVLEHKMDYEITLLSAELDAAYKTVAENEADAFMESWQPVLHQSYLQKYADQIVDLGPVFDSTQSGLVVPAYMPVDSIRELCTPAVREKLGGMIKGIEQGAGIMSTTREAISAYNLPYELQSSSGPAMTAALNRAILNKEWIVVTGWKPHWMFGKWDLKFLQQDPDKKIWSQGSIHIMGAKNIETEKPALAVFLRNMKLSESQLYDLMLTIEDKKTKFELSEITKRWMENHTELVESWIPKDY